MLRIRAAKFALALCLSFAVPGTPLAGEDAMTPLMDAASANDYALVESLICDGADVNERTESGYTAASYVFATHSLAARVRTLDALARAGASLDVNAVSYSSDPVPLLFQACMDGDVDSVAYLLVHGADADAVDAFSGTNAWQWAAMLDEARTLEKDDSSERRIRLFRTLDAAGVPYGTNLAIGYSPVCQAVDSPGASEFTDYDLLDALLSYHLRALEPGYLCSFGDLGQDLSALIRRGLSREYYTRFDAVLRACLEAGMPADATDGDGVSLAETLCANTDDGVAAGMLLDADPPVRALDSLLSLAIERGNSAIAVELLRHGAIPGSDETGNALHAVLLSREDDFDRSDAELVKALLASGVSAGEGPGQKSTPLYRALYRREKYPAGVRKALYDSVEKERRDAIVSLVRADRKADFRENMDRVANESGLPLALIGLFVALSVICREWAFAKSPSSNGMAAVNAALAGSAACGLVAGACGLMLDRDYYGHSSVGMLIAIPAFAIVFALIGACVGAFLPRSSKAKRAFQSYRFLYYLPSAVALAVAVRVIALIWRN